ncbi:MAG: hypothetical protein K2L21_02730 [Muribaculaceae bacterium]|nr:hypothetical protein [Muribaculaceae bacterium]
MKVILLSIAIVGVCVLLLGVKVFFVPGARFPSGHIHEHAALRRRGISCASSGQDHDEKTKQKHNNHQNNPS